MLSVLEVEIDTDTDSGADLDSSISLMELFARICGSDLREEGCSLVDFGGRFDFGEER